jgi:hypothetical protein
MNEEQCRYLTPDWMRRLLIPFSKLCGLVHNRTRQAMDWGLFSLQEFALRF